MINVLNKHIPPQASPLLADWLIGYQCQLIITKQRHTKLGDYRPPQNGNGHVITINNNLNTYAFMVTLVHEVAHLSCYILYGNRVAPHGVEWKLEFKRHIWFFLSENLFPPDVDRALKQYMKNPAASSCSDINLQMALKNYDADAHLKTFLQAIPDRAVFKIPDGRIFTKGERVRKRYRCVENATRKVYLISPVAEVQVVDC